MGKKYPWLGPFYPFNCPEDNGPIFTPPGVDKFIIEN
jgi:hypothetical protein